MKNLKVSMKLLVGFGVMVAIILAISLVSVFNMRSIDTAYSKSIDNDAIPLNPAINAYGAIHAIRAEIRGAILNAGNKDKVNDEKKSLDRWCKEFEDSATSFGKFATHPDVKKLYDDAMKKYETVLKPAAYKMIDDVDKGVDKAELMKIMDNTINPAADDVAENFVKATDVKSEQLVTGSNNCTDLTNSICTLMVILLIAGIIIAVFFGVYISAIISKPLGTTVNMINEMSQGHLDMRLRLDRHDEIGVMAKTMDTFADDLQHNVVGNMKRISNGDLEMDVNTKDNRDEVSAAIKNTVEALHSLISDDGGRVLEAAANKDLTLRLTRDYKGDYARMKDNINTVVDTIDGANSQILASAQSLAEGSNEQASSLEEVSASLEEIASMTKQNADNSNQAKILATEARAAAKEGDASMKRMAEAINQIKQSSDNTAKIIKSIDDIAFQTNLLALNAAVEAARAGDAGKGFAVVAGEVRNLAMRSAEAAKNTADMIDESVKNAEGGVRITEEVAKSLSQIVDRIIKVGDLITEIATASDEQSQGVNQVNVAIAQMSQVTQNLSKQASELAEMANAFKLSAGGVGAARSTGAKRSTALPPPHSKLQHRPIVAALPDKSAKNAAPPKTVTAEDVIPLDDDELHDF
ncbi:methyl-accepting chemotaxis protein [Fibrobacteres bacterium R8-0-B4]